MRTPSLFHHLDRTSRRKRLAVTVSVSSWLVAANRGRRVHEYSPPFTLLNTRWWNDLQSRVLYIHAPSSFTQRFTLPSLPNSVLSLIHDPHNALYVFLSPRTYEELKTSRTNHYAQSWRTTTSSHKIFRKNIDHLPPYGSICHLLHFLIFRYHIHAKISLWTNKKGNFFWVFYKWRNLPVFFFADDGVKWTFYFLSPFVNTPSSTCMVICFYVIFAKIALLENNFEKIR